MRSQKDYILIVLTFAAFFVFAGRSYQFLFFDAPLRVLLWDQDLMEGPVRALLGIDWDSYATNYQVDYMINFVQILIGGLFGIAALSAFFIQRHYKSFRWFIYFGVLFLLILNALQFKDRFYQIPTFLEHITQVVTPVLLLLYVHQRNKIEIILWTGKITIASTFFSHGLYAIGFYPRPGKFIDLVIGTFHCSEDFAATFVLIAGWIDLAVAIAVLFRPFTRQALIYMTFWGLITAFSRVTSGVYLDFFWQSLHQNLHLTVYRLCHGLVPFALYMLQVKSGK